MGTGKNRLSNMSFGEYRTLGPMLLLLAVFSIQAQAPQSQTPNSASQEPTIKSEVRLVLVDVVVTQGKGEPVVGLHKEDLQVSEDGRPQTISFFEEHTGGTVSAVALPPTPPDVYTNYPTIKTTASINVLLLDSLNTQATDQTYVRPQMVKYLQAALAARTGARVAIFTLGSKLRMVRGFTADSAGLLMALTDSKSGTEAKFESQMASPSRKHSDQLACSTIRAPIGKVACEEFLAEEEGARSGDRVVMTLQAFQALARYLSRFPGRKNVMWVSGSFPLSFFPETNPRGVPRKEYRSEIRQTADLLTADQVAVYPISATGLTGEEATQSDNYGRPIHDGYSDRAFDQIAMETLARDTGGRAFYNTNDLSNAMTEAINSGSHYYTLTYTPTNMKMDGKYRRIEVKETNGSYKLNYRRGYYAENVKFAPGSEDQRKSDALVPLMAFGMPDFEQILFKMQLVKVKTGSDGSRAGSNTELKGPVIRYSLDFAISAQDLRLKNSADGARHGNIEVMLAAYDPDGALLNSFRKKSEVVLNPKAYLEVMQVGLQMHREIDVPEGQVLLRTGIYDLNSGKAGTLGAWVGDQK
jgi:VWFA-related protein